jgi:hypothetical protein
MSNHTTRDENSDDQERGEQPPHLARPVVTPANPLQATMRAAVTRGHL